MAGRGRGGRGRGGRRSQNDEFLDRDFEIEELKRQVQELQERLDQRHVHDTEEETSGEGDEDENPFHRAPS